MPSSQKHTRSCSAAGQAELKLGNAISSELTDMRPSLLPNLIAAAGRNMARGFTDFALSEVGHAYAGTGRRMKPCALQAFARVHAATRMAGRCTRKVDAFDAKSDVLAVLEACGMAASTLQVVHRPRPGFIPADPAPSRWVRRTRLPTLAKCIQDPQGNGCERSRCRL